MRNIIVITILAGLLGGCGGELPDASLAQSAAPPPVTGRRPADQRFYVLDTNRDGFLEPDETAGHWTEVFDIMDRNGNGRLSAAEFMALPNPHLDATDRMMQMGDPRRWRAYTSLDRKGVGYITLAEWLDASDRLFDMLDRSGDGRLSPEDLGINMTLEGPPNVAERLPPPPPRSLPETPVPPVPPPAAIPAPELPLPDQSQPPPLPPVLRGK